MEWTGYDFCARYVQRLYSRSTTAVLLGCRACFLVCRGANHPTNNIVAYRTIATKVVDSMNFVAVVVHFVISTIYVENYETQQIHIIG